MSKYAVMPITDYVETCDAIRDKTLNTDSIKSGELPNKVNEVYGAGVSKGIEQGQQIERDTFWDSFQNGVDGIGWRRRYSYAFCSARNLEKMFYPKYDFDTNYAVGMFRDTQSLNFNLAQRLRDCGVTLYTSSALSVAEMFRDAFGITTIPPISFEKCGTQTNCVFYNCYDLVTIEEIIVTPSTWFYDTAFFNCYNLKNIRFNGVICTPLDLRWSHQLSKESIINIIEHLVNPGNELYLVFSLTAIRKAFGSENSAEWLDLIAKASFWTINLI